MNEVKFLKEELSDAKRYNNIMTALVIVMAIWIADLTARHWNCVL